MSMGAREARHMLCVKRCRIIDDVCDVVHDVCDVEVMKDC
jgi:hypothetical protein